MRRRNAHKLLRGEFKPEVHFGIFCGGQNDETIFHGIPVRMMQDVAA